MVEESGENKKKLNEDGKQIFHAILNRLSRLGNTGYVVGVADGIVKAIGLRNLTNGELVLFPEVNMVGLTCNLNRNTVDILILGDDKLIVSGSLIVGSNSRIKIPVTTRLLGRVVNALGQVIDGGDEINSIQYNADIDIKAPGIIYREKVSEPVFTGIKIVDSLIPIGRGQRELIIGDKNTGKTSLCLDAILNQKTENYKNKKDKIFCVYVSIGQKRSSVKSIMDNLKKSGADKYTTIVSASASDSASLQYLAPYTGCAIAEYFMGLGHSIVIYDDLTQHAAAYRQISLLLRRPPGREAFPGDIFYLHSRLLERALKLHRKYGGGSVTALPIIETLFGDVTAYIPTNVISITDGQIFLDKNLFLEGIIPAVNIGLSVSRVGSAAQILAMKLIAGSLKLELAQYREVKDFVKFGSDLNDETLKIIKRGRILTELLKQNRGAPASAEEQVLTLFAGLNGYLDSLPVNQVKLHINKIFDKIKRSQPLKIHYNLMRDNTHFKKRGIKLLKVIFNYLASTKFI